jgi:hypothetical protein
MVYPREPSALTMSTPRRSLSSTTSILDIVSLADHFLRICVDSMAMSRRGRPRGRGTHGSFINAGLLPVDKPQANVANVRFLPPECHELHLAIRPAPAGPARGK